MTDLAALVVRLEADASQYLKALDQATQRLNKFDKDQRDALNGIGDKMKEFAVTVAAAFTVEKVIEFGKQAIESAAQLEKMSQITGVSVQNLAGLNLAFAAVGLESEATGTAFKKLNVAISDAGGNATSKAGAAFRTMGIDVKNANGTLKDAGTIQNEIADYFSKTADGANKVALAVAVFGKAGQAMIPVLDQGAAGLAAYQKQAEEWGLTISNQAARAAEDFEKKIRTLDAAMTGSFSAQLTAKLLPVLNSLVDSFTAGGNAGQALGDVAEFLVDIFKVLATAVVIIVGQFKAWINAMDGVVRAAHDLVSFDWAKMKNAGHDLGQGFEDAGNTITNSFAAVHNLWTAQTADAKKYNDEAAKKPDAKSLSQTQEFDKAKDALDKYVTGLQAQAATFGLGEAALVKYKLAFGDLRKDVETAGDDGKRLAAEAIAAATKLQSLKDTKATDAEAAKLKEQTLGLNAGQYAAYAYKITTGDLGDAFKRMGDAGAVAQGKLLLLEQEFIRAKDVKPFEAIADEVDKLNGKLVLAAQHAFDVQHQGLKDDAAAVGDTKAQENIDKLREATTAQAAYAEQVAHAQAVEQNLANTEAQINALRAAGQITDLQAQAKLDAAHQQEIGDLEQIRNAEQKIASDSGLPQLIQQTQAFATQIINLKTQVGLLEQQVRANLEQAFANNFADLITGAKSFRDALKGFFKDIEKMFVDMIAKQYAQQLFGVGGPAGGAAGGIAGILGGGGGASGFAGIAKLFSGFLGGGSSGGSSFGAFGAGAQNNGMGGSIGNIVGSLDGYAVGGNIPQGSAGIVGENGPELAYAGTRDLHIQPLSSGKGDTHVHNNFTVVSQNGTISRQSQQQIASSAARSLQAASQRNNR